MPCENKNIYPTAVLLGLCSFAFDNDHALVQHHLCNVVSAFCARAKVRFPSALGRFFDFLLFLISFVIREDHALSLRLTHRQVCSPTSEEQFKEIWKSFTQASGTPSPPPPPPSFLHKSTTDTVLMLQTCFCSVLKMQRLDASVTNTPYCPHDEHAADMLATLSRPFMV